MTRLFGTDGVRGIANLDLTPDLALALGRAAGRVLATTGESVLVGRDTRLSGPMLEAALVAGLASAGLEVGLLGIAPSPAGAWLTVHRRAAAGAVISASHNPVDDNGLKFFSDAGYKLPTAVEEEIERAMAADRPDAPTGAQIGGISRLEDALEAYLEHLASTLDTRLEGLKVVLDCAHGAAWKLAPEAFRRAGADVTAIHDTPDGSRINVDCGSTSLDDVSTAVRDRGADLGLALDGDADRVLAVDESGRPLDGDRIMGVTALRLHEQQKLENNLVVATVMSNLGFLRALEHRGIEVIRARVGDKFVVEAMTESGAVLGGEQSGHVIFGKHATTGDGVLTGLQLAAALSSSGAKASDLADFYDSYPQVLINVPAPRKHELEEATGVWDEVARAEERLGEDGTILVRASGTEPLVRVMVEAPEQATARRVAESLADAVRQHLG